MGVIDSNATTVLDLVKAHLPRFFERELIGAKVEDALRAALACMDLFLLRYKDATGARPGHSS
jgi:hypothetical protein